ncbi:MAG: hypothetical protein RL154_1170 [Pseudomonadota bacterium]|jgi:TolB-like protein
MNIKLSLSILTIALFAGCGQKSLNYDLKPNFMPDSNKSCMVLPFNNLTTNIAASDAVAGFFATELKRKNICTVIEKSDTKQKQFDIKQAIEFGKKQGVDYVFVGSVSEYNYQYGLREDPAVGISAKMISVTSGDVIWSGDEGRVGRSFLMRDSLDATAIDSVKSLISTIK